MKRTLILTAALLFLSTQPALAHINQFVTEINQSGPQSQSGVKFDAPHLIGLKQLSPDLYLGIEGGKEILTEIFNGETRHYFESGKGYFGYIKATYNKCFFNCP